MNEPLCAELEPAISEWIDGTLDLDARRQVDGHIAVCARCRALADDLRSIQRAARALEEPTAPPGVWPAVSRQLVAEARTRRAWLPERWGATSWAGLAAAATVVLAIGFGWSLIDRVSPTDARLDDPAGAADAAGTGTGALFDLVEVELRAAEAHYDGAVAGLTASVDTPGGATDMDVELTATFQESLALIDSAIAESRAALAVSPDSEPAQDSLFEGMRRKVGLLQNAIALINEMRKGNQIGAAQVVEGMQR